MMKLIFIFLVSTYGKNLTYLHTNEHLFDKDLTYIISSEGVEGFGYRVRYYDLPYIYKENTHKFILNHGYCVHLEDCEDHRERIEARSTNFDFEGNKYCYEYLMRLDDDFNFMSPKQIIGQWHDKKYGDMFSFRLLDKKLSFSHQISGKTVYSKKVSYKAKGWNKVRVSYDYQKKLGSYKVWMNDKVQVDRKNVALYEDPVINKVYFKFGIYRSHLHKFSGKQRPQQIVYYKNIKRSVGKSCDKNW